MLEQIKAAWPEFSEQSIGLYGGFIKEKAAVYGRLALEKTIRDAIDVLPKLPKVAELKGFLPAGAAKCRASTQGDCPECEGTGWAWADAEKKRVKRCHCWRKESA